MKREQYEEAVAVHVTEARIMPEAWGSQKATVPDLAIECPAVIVLNRSRYTITRLQAQLCLNGNSLLPYSRQELISSVGKLPEEITAGLTGEGRVIWGDTLRSTDIGMRFSSDAITVRDLYGSYPIVRWRDRWNTWWEYKHGEVREITESEPWKP